MVQLSVAMPIFLARKWLGELFALLNCIGNSCIENSSQTECMYSRRPECRECHGMHQLISGQLSGGPKREAVAEMAFLALDGSVESLWGLISRSRGAAAHHQDYIHLSSTYQPHFQSNLMLIKQYFPRNISTSFALHVPLQCIQSYFCKETGPQLRILRGSSRGTDCVIEAQLGAIYHQLPELRKSFVEKKTFFSLAIFADVGNFHFSVEVVRPQAGKAQAQTQSRPACHPSIMRRKIALSAQRVSAQVIPRLFPLGRLIVKLLRPISSNQVCEARYAKAAKLNCQPIQQKKITSPKPASLSLSLSLILPTDSSRKTSNKLKSQSTNDVSSIAFLKPHLECPCYGKQAFWALQEEEEQSQSFKCK